MAPIDGLVRRTSPPACCQQHSRAAVSECVTNALVRLQVFCEPYVAELTKVDEAVSKVLSQLDNQVGDKLAALNTHVSNNVSWLLPRLPARMQLFR